MTNTPLKTKSQHQNPLNIPVSSVGNGFVAVLPGTPPSIIDAEPLSKTVKNIRFERINTEWLAPFLDEYQLTESHTPHGVIVVTHEGGLFQVRANLSFSPLQECARCLRLFRTTIETTSKAVFADKARFTNPVQSSHRGRSRSSENDWDSDDSEALQSSDLDLYEFSGLAFCLEEFLLDSMQTEIPDVTSCVDSCPGLCSNCGSLNTDDHICSKKS